MYFVIIIAAVVIDQILKHLVRTGLDFYESIPVFGDFLTITLHFNTGAAFSMMQGYRVLLTALPMIMIVAILVYVFIKRKTDHKLLLISLSLIAGGGLGNLIDRVFMGQVTDYISVGTFPVFNFADMCVVTGCGLVIVYMLFFDKSNKDKDNDTPKRV